MSRSLTMQEPYKKQLEGMLMTHVAPLFASPHGHLRAKAAWVRMPHYSRYQSARFHHCSESSPSTIVQDEV